MCIRDRVIVDKVSSDVSISGNNDSEVMVNNDSNEVVENEASKKDTLNDSRNDDENRRIFAVSNGVVISVNELEREYMESLNVEWVQRANFPGGICLSLIHI